MILLWFWATDLEIPLLEFCIIEHVHQSMWLGIFSIWYTLSTSSTTNHFDKEDLWWRHLLVGSDSEGYWTKLFSCYEAQEKMNLSGTFTLKIFTVNLQSLHKAQWVGEGFSNPRFFWYESDTHFYIWRGHRITTYAQFCPIPSPYHNIFMFWVYQAFLPVFCSKWNL